MMQLFLAYQLLRLLCFLCSVGPFDTRKGKCFDKYRGQNEDGETAVVMQS